jgi:DNA-directed RNA polymerase III subunit RPC6
MPSVKREAGSSTGGSSKKAKTVARSGDQAKVVEVLEGIGKKGASQDEIQDKIDINPETLQKCITALLGSKKIELFNRANGNGDTDLVFKLTNTEDNAPNSDFGTKEEEFVFQTIARSGDRGIWTKDIKMQSGLPTQTLTKIYKALEGRRAIKTVKSITSKSKKMYMLYNLEPSKELTGGPWYTEQEFDHQFIDELRNYCFSLITNHPSKSQSVREITEQLLRDNISKVKLVDKDVEQLVRTLELDGKVEAFKDDSDGEAVVRYRVMRPLFQPYNVDKARSKPISTRFSFQHWEMVAKDFAWKTVQLGDFEPMGAHEPHHHHSH